MKSASFFFVAFFCFLAEASGESSFSGRDIFFQSLNFILFFAALLMLLKKPIKSLFQKRLKDFLAFEEQAKKQQETIENSFKEWQDKIKDLENKEKTIDKDAETRGQEIFEKKEQEMLEYKKRKDQEKTFFIQLESEKLKKESLIDWKSKIVDQAKNQIQADLSSSKIQEDLYQDFFKQIKRVDGF